MKNNLQFEVVEASINNINNTNSKIGARGTVLRMTTPINAQQSNKLLNKSRIEMNYKNPIFIRSLHR